MLWERPKTLRMMFLLQNLARIDAKNNIEGLRTPKASTVRIRNFNPRLQSGDQSEVTFKKNLQN